MKNILTASAIALVATTVAVQAFACPGHHKPCSPTECAPAKESNKDSGKASGKAIAQESKTKATPEANTETKSEVKGEANEAAPALETK